MKQKKPKVKIKIIALGYFPFEFNTKKIECWKSKLFDINGNIVKLKDIRKLTAEQDNFYPDDYLIERINEINLAGDDSDFIFVISNIKLKDDWFSRILDKNKVIMSYYTILDTLRNNNIPIENAVITLLYTYALLYRKFQNRIPTQEDEKKFLHTDRRGCIFDLSPSSNDIIYTCISPIICDECREELKKTIDNNIIPSINKELRKIKKSPVNRIASIIKWHPTISALFTLTLPISLTIFVNELAPLLNMTFKIIIMLIPFALLLLIWIVSLIKKWVSNNN